MLSDTNASYTPGISERRSSTTTYLHSGLKNVGAQSNTSKVVTASKEFDAFGEDLGATGTWKGQSGYGGGFGYQSAERSGLMLLGHRYYDPSTGSFLTSDPAKSGDNWFAYCSNNPLTGADLAGLLAMFGFEFTWGGFGEGLATGGAAVLSSLSFGLYDGGRFKDQPGFATSVILADIGTMVMPGGQTKGLAKGALKALSVGKAAKISHGGKIVVQRVMSVLEYEHTLATKLLRGGRQGEHFVTTVASNSAKRAQQRLALNKLPEVRVQMVVDEIHFGPIGKVDPMNGMPGGGLQRIGTGEIPVEIINVWEMK